MSNSSSPIRVVLWRHGQTDWNVENRFQGHSDIPLNKVGEYQVTQAAEVLAGLNPNRIISRDSIRAQSTAAALAKSRQASYVPLAPQALRHKCAWRPQAASTHCRPTAPAVFHMATCPMALSARRQRIPAMPVLTVSASPICACRPCASQP